MDISMGLMAIFLNVGRPRRPTPSGRGNRKAGQRIRATQSLMRSQGMTDGEYYRDLLTRLSTALATTKAAYLAARRRRDL
jgi:hypothetical protein